MSSVSEVSLSHCISFYFSTVFWVIFFSSVFQFINFSSVVFSLLFNPSIGFRFFFFYSMCKFFLFLEFLFGTWYLPVSFINMISLPYNFKSFLYLSQHFKYTLDYLFSPLLTLQWFIFSCVLYHYQELFSVENLFLQMLEHPCEAISHLLLLVLLLLPIPTSIFINFLAYSVWTTWRYTFKPCSCIAL